MSTNPALALASVDTERAVIGSLLIDPDDPGDIARALCRAVEEPDLRRDLCRKGSARAAGFTWERCIRQTVELYKRLGGGAGGN